MFAIETVPAKKNCSLHRKYNEEANFAAVLLIFYVRN